MSSTTVSTKRPLKERNLLVPAEVPLNFVEAAHIYRYQCHWAVHPLHGPHDAKAPEAARGKKPLHSGWPSWTADQVTNGFIEASWGNGSANNIGIVVRSPHIVIDLDSKTDHGESAHQWVQAHPELQQVPRERTGGGVHLHFTCDDLPAFTKNGVPFKAALRSKLDAEVSAELYSDGLNVVVSPSIHPSGQRYFWEITGQIPTVSWAKLQEIFEFRLPDEEAQACKPKATRGRPKKTPPWWAGFKGDIATLDIVALTKRLGIYGETLDAEEKKHSIRCPWADEHSDTGGQWKPSDSSACIWEAGEGKWPAFKCLHSGTSNHADAKTLEHLLLWADQREPGVVDRFCSRERVYSKENKAKDGRPRVVQFGPGKELSEFASEVGRLVGPCHQIFRRGDQVVVIREQNITEAIRSTVFHELTPIELCSEIEKYIEVGVVTSNEAKENVFTPLSLGREKAAALLAASQFKSQLPAITRILDVPVPILATDGQLMQPRRGYDARFGTYLDPNAPRIEDMDLAEARQWLNDLFTEFCFADEQSRVHALARLISAFVRGIMGWQARFPLFVYRANQPRVGKDYCASCVTVLFEGHASEDAPLEVKNEPENKKRITAALASGRRFFHSANCVGFVQSENLMEAVTGKVWADRRLGSNGPDADLKLPNELLFSLSANVGIGFKEDFAGRIRFIELAYPGENPNARKFHKTDLHGWVHSNRGKLLSALAALVRHWNQAGRPSGPTAFASFPEWARVVGGIMLCAGLGDPCLPHQMAAEIGVDRLLDDMRTLFSLCFAKYPNSWIKKAEIYKLIEGDKDLQLFEKWGTPDERSYQVRLGNELRKYAVCGGRALKGIQLAMDEADKSRPRYRFYRVDGGPLDPTPSSPPAEAPAILPDNRPDTAGSNANPADLANLCNPVTPQDKNIPVLNKQGDLICPGVGELRNIRNIHTIRTPSSLVVEPSALNAIAEAIHHFHGPVALDLETYGKNALNPWNGDIRLLTLLIPGLEPWLLDLKAIGYDLGPLRPVLEARRVIIHNANFDALWLRVKIGLRLTSIFCTMTASRLITAGTEEKNDLGTCVSRHLGVDLRKDQARSDWGKDVLTEDQLAYAADDVCHLHSLADALKHELEEHDLAAVARLEMNLLPVVVDMEFAGVPFDRVRAEQLLDDCEKEAKAVSDALKGCCGTDFNPASPPQIKEALREQGVDLESTDEATLSACTHPLARRVLEYRSAMAPVKQIKTLLKAVSEDGRIHASFNATGADTGRFTSKGPNLQNIARGPLRSCFAAPPGYRLVDADYSQVELRIAAVVANETAMLTAFNNREDLHRKTAALVLEKPADQVTKDDRQLAKAVNFGLLFGQSAEGLVKYARTAYGVRLDPAKAKLIREKFLAAYPGLARWHKQAWRQAEQGIEEVRTITRRRRKIPATESNWNRFTALVNTPVQGGAADGMKLAMLAVAKALPAGARMILTVHDELLVECPETMAEQVKMIVDSAMREEMQRLFPAVPIDVEAKVCSHWGEK